VDDETRLAVGAVIRCECGWALRAESSEELVAAMEQHLVEEHPDLPAPAPRADLLAMVEKD
jgi:hypothetical protein